MTLPVGVGIFEHSDGAAETLKQTKKIILGLLKMDAALAFLKTRFGIFGPHFLLGLNSASNTGGGTPF